MIAVPVIKAARKPARDLRDARGRPRNGTRAGSGGVLDPHRRPKVEAAVSAQESLLGQKVQMRQRFEIRAHWINGRDLHQDRQNGDIEGI